MFRVKDKQAKSNQRPRVECTSAGPQSKNRDADGHEDESIARRNQKRIRLFPVRVFDKIKRVRLQES